MCIKAWFITAEDTVQGIIDAIINTPGIFI